MLDNAFSELKKSLNEKLLVISSECTIAPAIVAYSSLANSRKQPRIIWIDAHADINEPASSPSGKVCGMSMGAISFRIKELQWSGSTESIVSTSNIIYYGLRSVDPPEDKFLNDNNFRVANDFVDLLNWVALSATPVYLHIDLDAIDPNEMPAVNYPVPNGIKASDLANFIKGLDFNLIQVVSLCSFNSRGPEVVSSLAVIRELYNLIYSRMTT